MYVNRNAGKTAARPEQVGKHAEAPKAGKLTDGLRQMIEPPDPPGANLPEPASAPTAAPAASQPTVAATASGRGSLLDQLTTDLATAFPAAQIEDYLQASKRSAESLLAAFRASQDTNYLREAASNYPNALAVQFAVIANRLYPEAERNWIEAFKTAAPDNSLGWYFSALDYFRSKQPEAALRELVEASRLPGFDNDSAQTIQAVEELHRLSGRSTPSAKFAAACGGRVSLACLSRLKALGNEIYQAQQSCQEQGNSAWANSFAAAGLVLGDRLRQKEIFEQISGAALQKKILGRLDPAWSYDFLDRPVSEKLAEIDRQRQSVAQLMQVRDRLLPSLREAELCNYFDREKLYGEIAAMQWLQAQYDGAIPPSGPAGESNP